MQAPGPEEMNLAEVHSASKRLPSELLCRNWLIDTLISFMGSCIQEATSGYEGGPEREHRGSILCVQVHRRPVGSLHTVIKSMLIKWG